MAENATSLSANSTEISEILPPPGSCDMEEGELPDSEDEIDFKQLKDKNRQAYGSFRQSNYRSVIDTDDDDDSDSDEDYSWKRKKQKVFQQPRNKCVQDDTDRNDCRKPPVIAKRTNGKKVNNIWGSVMQEQTQDMVSSRLTTVGLDFSSTRGVESYNHQRSLETEAALPFGTHQLAPRGRDVPQAFGDDDDLFADKIEPEPADEKDDIDGGMDAEEENVKQNAKQRLGKRPEHLPSVDAKKIDINPDDGIKIVAGNIAYSLWEPKRHLVYKTVEMIGTEKSVEIYNEVMVIEEGGGMLINNKKRRRSPGGVFFHLLRNSYGIEKQILDEIFAADDEFPRNRQKEKKDKKKRKQSNNKKMEVTVSEND